LSEQDFTLQRTELEAVAGFGRWTTTLMYGNYAAQPLIGFLNRREGILGTARVKMTPNWVLLGGAGYDLHAHQVSQTQIGVGYIDDCLILAFNYITSYAYSGSVSVNHSYMAQVTLRTLGGTTNTGAGGAGGLGGGAFGGTH
jgi:LPS-assembly protein